MEHSTMQIFNYYVRAGYEMLDFYDGDDWEKIGELNGEPRAHNWKPMRVRRVRINNRMAFRPSDSPFNSADTLVFRRSAVDALRDILDANGELLPLEDEGGVELYAFNPRVLDALDHKLTVGSRDEDGRVWMPNNHVFIPSIVEGVDIFRQAAERAGRIYLSDRFLQRWKQAKLKGLEFKLAWDSELPPEKQPNVWESKPVKL
jgi:hypothetical protein